jgi:hypothetical protein
MIALKRYVLKYRVENTHLPLLCFRYPLLHDQKTHRQPQVPAEQVLSWELNVYDTQKGAFWGAQQEFYADSQLVKFS